MTAFRCAKTHQFPGVDHVCECDDGGGHAGPCVCVCRREWILNMNERPKTAEEWAEWSVDGCLDSLVNAGTVGQMIFDAVAAEREACAKILEADVYDDPSFACSDCCGRTLSVMAERIRARGRSPEIAEVVDSPNYPTHVFEAVQFEATDPLPSVVMTEVAAEADWDANRDPFKEPPGETP